ncbi:MAG: bifunctional DNA-formamidopyrimidine glycosylase/DNA-(apurinic or apyrimidinic site) lyase [Deltaproteobacteria bacterium]|jgi:formamidopyrimidine-DNA glycosylase|nr:bifunctional DNA-formamidopyrimidine glycosylase/DNA-(apurinic or apyrimidinic site) lyase [Deltaproteobacteria bacterium]
MPELPEVETIARTLAPMVKNRYINKFSLLSGKTLEAGLELSPLLQGARVCAVRRRAKLLLLDVLGNGAQPLVIGFHLKMTGRLFVHELKVEPHKHTKIVFDLHTRLEDALPESRLFFDDVRTFGYCRIMRPSDMPDWSFWSKLGLEPLEHSPDILAERLQSRRGQIKNALLDQTVIAGIGNIYADEALFRAGIKPDCKLEKIELPRVLNLCRQMQEILEESIAACGSSIRDYRDAEGNAGAFQNTFNVYGRAGQPCKQCETILVGARIAGRGSTYCPRCQTF